VLSEHDQADVRVSVAQLEGGVQSVELRHADVDHGDVGILTADQPHRFTTVRGLSGHRESGAFQQLPQSLPHEHVVVGEHQSDRHLRSSVADARVLFRLYRAARGDG
jgi:hypothetical protein